MNASRTRLLFTLFALFQLAVAANAATTKVQFTSLSVLVSPATTEDPGIGTEVTLTLSSTRDDRNPNWELSTATSDHGFSHESFGLLEDEIFGITPFDFVLDIPPYDDVNLNGIDDFYDVNASVDGIETFGFHLNAEGGAEQFTALWYRDAGTTVGTVIIDFPYFGMRFEHFYELVQFDGEYTYTKTGSQLQGNLALTNVVNPDDRITGPLSVTIVDNNTLNLNATTWSSTLRENLEVEDNFYDGRVKTNFISFWFFEDGYAGTVEPDYMDWTMVLISEDANSNGVMDLVEGGGTEPQRPSLAIRKTANGFEITVTGTAGKTYWLEYTSTVTNTNWPDHHVVSMTTETEVVTLPADATGHLFYRLREAPAP
jgi:hypothetical protein